MFDRSTGGCACGRLRYEASAAPAVAFHCQCRDCQRFSGGGHVSALVFPAELVRIIGQARFRESPTESGHMARRGFCDQCGSPIMAGTSAAPQLLGLMAGSLDEPGRFKPQMVIFHSRACAWDFVDPSLPTFEGMPPDAPSAGR